MTVTPAHVRAQLPALENWVWFNAAASSPLPRPVSDAVNAITAEASAQGDLGFARWLALRETTRGQLAQLVNATPREIALTPSTSFGFHYAATMLKARGITEVLTLASEFPSTTLPLVHGGLQLQVVPAGPQNEFTLDAIERALTPQTGAVAVSAVQFSTGFQVDLKGLSALCQAKKLPLLINAAQALGQLQLDVRALKPAFLAAPSHKWLMAGYGMAMLFVDEGWLDDPLPMGGWLSVPNEKLWQTVHANHAHPGPHATRVTGADFRHDASALEAGGANWAGAAALNAALTLHLSLDAAETRRHIVGLQLRLRRQLRAMGFTPSTADDEATISGICGIAVSGDPNEAVRHLLRDARIVTTARGGQLRLSTHVFNTEHEVDLVCDALKRGVRPA